jgi:hypothetical protein
MMHAHDWIEVAEPRVTFRHRTVGIIPETYYECDCNAVLGVERVPRRRDAVRGLLLANGALTSREVYIVEGFVVQFADENEDV